MPLLRFFLLIAWCLPLVTLRRLVRGPRHPLWSWRAEVSIEVMRRSAPRLSREPVERFRAGLLPTVLPPALRKRVAHTRDTVAGLPAEVFTPRDWTPEGPTLLYFHGGGYVVCGPGTHRDTTARLAHASGARVISVDYHLAPESPFPGPVREGVACIQEVMSQVPAHRLLVGGDSAGGGLTLAALLSLRDQGAPLPSGAVLLSPWVDLTLSGDTIDAHAHLCYLDRPTLNRCAALYLQGHDPADPLASPLHADLRGLPPMLILTGGSEAFLWEDTELARRATEAGVEARLHTEPGMVHVWPCLAPVVPQYRDAFKLIGQWTRARLEADADADMTVKTP